MFNGTNAMVSIRMRLAASDERDDAGSLGNPSTASAWRDVIYKGNDNYYLEGTTGGGAPAGGVTAGSSEVLAYAAMA